MILDWLFRLQNKVRQCQPSLSGFLLRLRKLQYPNNTPVLKTVETYLPPISTKVTEAKTIEKYMKFLMKIAKSMNLRYCQIVLDVGAAMNAYHMIWKHSKVFSNVIPHLGDFHFLKENFKVTLFILRIRICKMI